MGRKAKEGSVNLYYLKNNDNKKNKSVSKTNAKKKSSPRKKTESKKKIAEDRFNFDDEIVIGVTKTQDNKKKNVEKVKGEKGKNTNAKSKKIDSSKTKKVQGKKKKEKSSKKFKIFKYTFMTCSVIAAIICFMLSPIFNITEIRIVGNDKISSQQIISLSEVNIGENIYKINKKSIINKIRQNAYVQSVEIKRDIPSVLEININERQATYMLEYVNGYAYINNQGYMLEISNEKIDKPILIGISTNADNIKAGNRLVEEDLMKLENVLKIMESASSNEIEGLITKIDISDKYNYKLYLETEGKTVKLGDITDISTKMLHIKKILEKEAGVEGEIIVDSVSKDSKSRFIQKIN